MPDEQYSLYDIWQKSDVGKCKNSITAEVEPHGAKLYRIY